LLFGPLAEAVWPRPVQCPSILQPLFKRAIPERSPGQSHRPVSTFATLRLFHEKGNMLQCESFMTANINAVTS